MDRDAEIERLARKLARTTVMTFDEATEQLQRLAGMVTTEEMLVLLDDRPVRLVANRAERRRAARKGRSS